MSDQDKQLQESIRSGLKETFRPEFLNRIDDVIIFENLTPAHMRQIVDLQIKEVAERLAEHDLSIELTDAARTWLATEGYDPKFGARPVRRTMERYVENPLSRRLLAGDFSAGDTVLVDVADGEDGKPALTFSVRHPEPVAIDLSVPAEVNA